MISRPQPLAHDTHGYRFSGTRNEAAMTVNLSEEPGEMFRPPINRAMRSLDRAFFQKRIPICAARVLDNKTISKCRSELQNSQDILRLERIANVRPDPAEGTVGRKCLLLKPDVREQGKLFGVMPLIASITKVLTGAVRLVNLEPKTPRAYGGPTNQYNTI